MFKQVLSALVVTGVLASGAAFAADTSVPSGQTLTPAQTSAAPAAPSPVKATEATTTKHEKVAHEHAVKKVKAEQASDVKAMPAKTPAATPEKTN